MFFQRPLPGLTAVGHARIHDRCRIEKDEKEEPHEHGLEAWRGFKSVGSEPLPVKVDHDDGEASDEGDQHRRRRQHKKDAGQVAPLDELTKTGIHDAHGDPQARGSRGVSCFPRLHACALRFLLP